MSFEVLVVIFVVAGAVILFVTEKLPIDLVAILIMIVLTCTGVLTPEEGVQGFSNPATITVAAMFVLSAALFKTGGVNMLGPKLAELIKKNYILGLATMMISVAVISAFVNNTPVVAVFIPIIMKAAHATKNSPSKFLIPLSYATIFGGTCTLIGTSTNILVSGVAIQNGLPPLTMFQFTPLGLIFLLAGTLYMVLIGRRLLPDRKPETDLRQKFGVRDYLTEIVLLKKASSAGKKIMDSPLVKELELDIIEIKRSTQNFILPPLDFVLQEGDRLKVRCNVDKIKDLKDRIKIHVNPRIMLGEESLTGNKTALVELVITANSEFEGKTLHEVEFKRKYRAIALAIKHRDEIVHERLSDVILRAGDVLLAEVKKHRLEELKKLEYKKESPFIIISEEGIVDYNPKRFILVLAIIAGVVASAALNLVPIMIGALTAVGLLVLTRSLKMVDVYEAIDWKVIFLLAGALSLGLAMEKSGVAGLMASGIVNNLGSSGPIIVLAGIYFITSILTEMMSNNAAAALVAPVAIYTADTLDLNPLPFLMAVAFAASASFMTPVGYQTNTMIYTAGQYKFFDFTRTGFWLNLLFWLLAVIFIPIIYPF